MAPILVGFIGSAAVHAAVLALLLKSPAEPPKTPPSPPMSAASARESSEAISVRLIPPAAPKSSSDETKLGAGSVKKTCTDVMKSYRGIGVTLTAPPWLVMEAPPQYPAYRAGIRPGDELIELYPAVDDNGYARYTVIRKNIPKVYRIKLEKICFEEQ